MRALHSVRVGGPQTLEVREIDTPDPSPDEVAIDVRACGVNFPDSLVIEDRYQLKPQRPFSPGSELSGVVRAVGKNVTEPKVGQRVLASLPFGAMADVVCVPADRCYAIPDSLPFVEAAAFQVTFGTVYYALEERGRLAPGETLLVLGAGGGIGLAAVQLGKALGARVVAAASSQDKLDLALAAGADVGVLYPSGAMDSAATRALGQAFKAACGEEGADVVLDPVGGAYAEPAIRTLGWGGRFLVVGFAAGIPSIPLNLTLLKGCQIIGVFWGARMARDPAGGARDMQRLFQFYEAGLIRPEVSETFPLERGGEAIARLGARNVRGKVVVTLASISDTE